MRSYPKPGETVRHKKTHELFTVKGAWKPGAVEMESGHIFYLRGIELFNPILDAQLHSNMRKVIPGTKCARCGEERTRGGAFRYGRLDHNETHTIWQPRTFCSKVCMRAYWRDRELLRLARAHAQEEVT